MRPDPAVLSIVIVSWNRAGDLERCLTSVFSHTTYSPLEVVVVDNGSSDGSVEVARSWGARITLIENERNLGAPAARNQGIEASTGSLVALLDCDAYVEDDVISRAARELLERQHVAMLGCKLCFPDGRRQHSAHRAMSIRLSLFQNLWLYRLLPRTRRAEVLLGGYWEEDREIEADWLTSAFLIFRRKVFDELGGFNPRLFPEDSEWGIRLTRAGCKLIYAPQLGTVYHTGSADLSADSRQLRLYHRAGVDAYRELNGRALALVYRWVQLLGSCVRSIVYRAGSRVRGDGYLASQASFYRSLVRIYWHLYRDGALPAAPEEPSRT